MTCIITVVEAQQQHKGMFLKHGWRGGKNFPTVSCGGGDDFFPAYSRGGGGGGGALFEPPPPTPYPGAINNERSLIANSHNFLNY